jgi:hypothetical protein
MPSDTELLEHLYDRFNARDLEAVLATMHLGARPDRFCDGHLLQGSRLKRRLRG